MHNQSNFELKYAHFDFADDFPIWGWFCDNITPSAEPIKSLHFHNCMEIGICTFGSGLFYIDNKVLPFSKGDVSIIFKNEMHWAQSTPDDLSKWIFISLNPEDLLKTLDLKSHLLISRLMTPQYGFDNIIKKKEHPEICQLVKLITDELKNKDANYKDSIKALVWALIIIIGRISSKPDRQLISYDDKSVHRILPAIEYISLNYMDELSISDLAGRCFLSVSHFRKLFKMVVHISPSEYVKNIKIQTACLLLKNTTKSIIDISEAVGFKSLCNFNRSFKKALGISPNQLRKSNVKPN